MEYKVKFLLRDHEAYAYGKTEEEAIQRILNDNVHMKQANKFDIAMVVFHIYNQQAHVSYATTYGKYLVEIE